ncbi:MAG: SUMF1/EgtB/PvdO family nonheme iron enzyme [Candidatus Xenobiia bacterium LiM19]
MFCQVCGTKSVDGALFCSKCGKSLVESAPAAGVPVVQQLDAGALLDRRYELISLISQGGFGRVYKARDNRFAANVAIKEMTGGYDSEEERAAMERYFQQEAQVLFGLKHPALPTVSDYFFERHRFFLVMEYIEGLSLRTIIEHNAGAAPFDEALAFSWFQSLLEIMEYLHRQNPPIIHRDIKPDNLIWQVDRKTLYLVDFGIVRVGCATKTMSYGTPGYASPEQASGKATPAVDIFGAGATLYHLLTGDDPADHPFDFEPLQSMRPDISPAFAGAVDIMVSLRARERFQSAGEIRRYLDSHAGLPALISPSVPAAPPSVPADPPSVPAAPPSVPADPPSVPAAPPSHPSAPPSLPAVSPSHPSAPPSYPAAPQSYPAAPPSHPAAPPSHPAVSPSHPAAPPSYPAAPPSHPAEPPPRLAVTLGVPASAGVSPPPPAEPPPRPVTPLSPAELPTGVTFIHVNPSGFEEYQNDTDNASLIWIPPGDFTMGAGSEDREARADEKPLHRVTLSGYWIYQYEVTNRQFALFVHRTGYSATPEWEEFWEKSGDHYPVVFITFHDAVAYCRWAGSQLPTEAQWERAARGGDERFFPWGSFFDNSRFNCWDSPVLAGRASFFDGKGPSKVGSCRGGDSPCGAADMAGNVWEWCLDTYEENFYEKSPGNDPFCCRERSAFKVLRGGSWNEIPRNCRLTRRVKTDAGSAARDRGFRCVIPSKKQGGL